MPASFDYYRIFYYVAKYKNFTRAAAVLLSSQPSVTRSMQNLESELDCRLFIRSRRGVTLTPEGETLYRYVAPAYEHIRRGEEELSMSLGLHGGSVSVGATETALHCLLLDKLALYQKEYPDVKLRISNGVTAQVLSNLKEGRTDIAVVPTPFQIEKPYTAVHLRPVKTILIGQIFRAVPPQKFPPGAAEISACRTSPRHHVPPVLRGLFCGAGAGAPLRHRTCQCGSSPARRHAQSGACLCAGGNGGAGAFRKPRLRHSFKGRDPAAPYLPRA